MQNNALNEFFDHLDGPQRLSKEAIIDVLEHDALVDGLIESLASSDPQVCISAAAVLGKLSVRRAIEPLSALVVDETQFTATRRVAARSLRRIAYNALFGRNLNSDRDQQPTVSKRLPRWLSEELTVLTQADEQPEPTWWPLGGSMLYLPSAEFEAAPRERLPEWVYVSQDELRHYANSFSELPGWLGH